MPYRADRQLELTPQLEQWAHWQRAQGVRERTIDGRVGNVGRFARRRGIDPASATTQDVVDFLATSTLSAATRRTYFSDLNVYFTWLVDFGARDDNPLRRMRSPRVPPRRPRPVTTDQLGALLATRMHRRARAMILLAAFQGLRTSEIASMRGEMVDLRSQTLRVIGKGGSDATLPLHPVLAELAMDMPSRGWWFPQYTPNLRGESGQPILASSVSTAIGQVMRRGNVPGSAHSLRHWYGTQVLKSAGGNLRVAQELLRHVNIQTTTIYTAVDDTERRAAVNDLPMPSNAWSTPRAGAARRAVD